MSPGDPELDDILAREIAQRGWMSEERLRSGLEAARREGRPLLELMRSHSALPPEQLAELDARASALGSPGSAARIAPLPRCSDSSPAVLESGSNLGAPGAPGSGLPGSGGPGFAIPGSGAPGSGRLGSGAPGSGSGSRLSHSIARTPGPRPKSSAGVLPPELIQALAARGVRLGEKLGAGGMGVVYAGTLADGQPCAIKVLLALGADLAVRFAREAEAARLVADDPRIVKRLMYVEAGQARALVLEYIPGGDLRAELRRAPIDVNRALELIADLAEALQAIHEAGVLHRDLKPENVLLREDGTPVITDFGLARLADAETLTRTREALGTAHYMSPEQAAGDRERLGPATDIWALGVMLYVMLTGTRPFVADNLVELMALLHEREPVPAGELNPEVDEALEGILASCLAKLPERRYPDAAALARDCRLRAEGLAPELAATPPRRRRLLPIGIGLLLIVGLAAAGGYGLHLRRLAQAERRVSEAFRPLSARLKTLQVELPRRISEAGIAKLEGGTGRQHAEGALAEPTETLLAALEETAPYVGLQARFLDSTVELRDVHAILRRLVEPSPPALPGEIESAFRLAAEDRLKDARAVLTRLEADPRRRRCAGFARTLIALDAGDIPAARTACDGLRSEGLEPLARRIEERALATSLWAALAAKAGANVEPTAGAAEDLAETLAQRFQDDGEATGRWQAFLQERLAGLTAGGGSPTLTRALLRLEELASHLPTIADVRAPKEVVLRRAELLVERATRGAELDRTLLRRAFDLYAVAHRLDPTLRLPESFKNTWIAEMSVVVMGSLGQPRGRAAQLKNDRKYWRLIVDTARLGRLATVFSLSSLARMRDDVIQPALLESPEDPVLHAILGLLPHRPDKDPPPKVFQKERMSHLRLALDSPLVGSGLKAWALQTLVREDRALARQSLSNKTKLQARRQELADTYGPRLSAVRSAHPRPWSLAIEISRLNQDAGRHEAAVVESRRGRTLLSIMRNHKHGDDLPPSLGDRDEMRPILPVNLSNADDDIKAALRLEIKALTALKRKQELAATLRELCRFKPRPKELLLLAELELEFGDRRAAFRALQDLPKSLSKSERSRRRKVERALRKRR